MEYVEEREAQLDGLGVRYKEHVFFNRYANKTSYLLESLGTFYYGTIVITGNKINCEGVTITEIHKALNMVNMVQKQRKTNEARNTHSNPSANINIMPTSISRNMYERTKKHTSTARPEAVENTLPSI